MYKKSYSGAKKTGTGGSGGSRGPKKYTGPVKKGNNPFTFRDMKRGAKKQKGQLGLDVSMFVRKAIEKTETVAFHPEHRFADFHIEERLKASIARRKYEHPTPIQDGAIPHILKGRDLIGIANTGTGKTAAFLIPLINKALLHPKERAIILVPTRELAVQIEEEFKEFAHGMGLTSVLTIGGVHLDKQARDVRRSPNFVIGTPGRVKDLIDRKFLMMPDYSNVVLDEVDRMLDMGFVKEIRHLLSLLPEKRQSLFFSATLERGAKDLAMKFLQDPIMISIPSSRATSENVDQDVIYSENREKKVEILHDLLLKPEFEKSIIFLRTKYGAAKLAKTLKLRGFQSDAIHGDLSQGQRKRALDGFRAGKVSVLVATDVAARGLDIDGVTHVINYDLPATYEDYIHRIGRTGRGSMSGSALTFIDKFRA